MFEKVVDVIKEILGKPVVMKNRKELEKRMYDDIIPLGNDRDFNRYIVTNIKDMSKLFARSEETPFSDFNGKIDKWDVSNVTNMKNMFDGSRLEKLGKLPPWYKAEPKKKVFRDEDVKVNNPVEDEEEDREEED